ncbi:MAG: ATP-dependent zinc metalloprotease FtsH [Prevotellaceae bacterium]|jgi:cell division protease FtsH|nr:ATP-dependent zinc metalloprotease FtsH [Prevotellaceae bacterium]
MASGTKSIKKTPSFLGGGSFKPNLNWLFFLIFVGLIIYSLRGNDVTTKEIPYSQFEKLAEGKSLSKIDIVTNSRQARGELKKEAIAQVFVEKEHADLQKAVVETSIPSVDETAKMLKESNFNGEVKYTQEGGFFETLFFTFGPILLFVGLWIFLMRRMSGGGGGASVFSVGKAKAQLFDKNNTAKITFKDVAGLGEAKQEIQEIVSFLKSPQKYTELGGKIPKGALLVGPPGTGKTLLAKAVAGEADVPFFSMSGSDFVEMFVGVGASRVRDLFRQAKDKSPCIIFIDEIDAVGRARSRGAGGMGVNDERENTLNQLLTEMDGFGTNSGVIILAATNRADILDKALLRAGRFDRQIHVGLPDLQERKEIFHVHLRPIKIGNDLDIDFLAKQTPGFSGADIANVCNESALIAARRDKSCVEKQDFLDAVDRIVGGLEKRTKIMTASEKRSIAYHEAGHATISWLIEHAAPLVKVTIVPRGEALGAAWYLPEERAITTKEHLLDEMCATLGGRAAEEIFFGMPSTGALSDLERVTKRAYAMVALYGMGDDIPNLSYYDSSGMSDYSFTKPYSERTAQLIDEETKRIVAEQYKRAKELLTTHKQQHNKLAELLIEKEVIFTDDLERIFGKRQWVSRADELLHDSDESVAHHAPEKHDEPEADDKQNAENKSTEIGTNHE